MDFDEDGVKDMAEISMEMPKGLNTSVAAVKVLLAFDYRWVSMRFNIISMDFSWNKIKTIFKTQIQKVDTEFELLFEMNNFYIIL